MLPNRAIRYFHDLIISVVLLSTVGGFAQIENIPINKEVNIDRLYVGLLANTNFPERSSTYSPSSFRSGARVSTWLIPKTLKVRSFGALILNEGRQAKYLKSYEAIFSITKSADIAMGVMATPTTELRPNPITWQSQVETQAESRIPGGKPGFKINYRFDENLKVTYGLHKHDNRAFQHFKLSYKKFTASTFLKDDKVFLAAKWNYKNSDLLLVKHDDYTAFSAIIPISTHYKFYLDMEYEGLFRRLTFGEWGFRRHFKGNRLLRGFFSINYNQNMKQLRGGLFIHI